MCCNTQRPVTVEISDSDGEAPPPNQNLSSLALIPGHLENNKIWSEAYVPAVRHDLGCSATPWESTTIGTRRYLQQQYDNHYETGHKVQIGGPVHKDVSSCFLGSYSTDVNLLLRCSNTARNGGTILATPVSKSFSIPWRLMVSTC